VLAGSKGMKALSERRLMHCAGWPVMWLFNCWYMIKAPLKELECQYHLAQAMLVGIVSLRSLC